MRVSDLLVSVRFKDVFLELSCKQLASYPEAFRILTLGGYLSQESDVFLC